MIKVVGSRGIIAGDLIEISLDCKTIFEKLGADGLPILTALADEFLDYEQIRAIFEEKIKRVIDCEIEEIRKAYVNNDIVSLRRIYESNH